MKLHKYRDYEDYRQFQIETTKRKISDDVHWVGIAEITAIVALLQAHHSHPIRGVCHGTRNNWEVDSFKQALPDSDIIGTDISPDSEKYGVIVHDFHEPKDKWLGRFDFVYSNSLDHSYNPQKAIDVWMEQLQPFGHLFIQWTKYDNEQACGIAPFAGSKEDYRSLFYGYRLKEINLGVLPGQQHRPIEITLFMVGK